MPICAGLLESGFLVDKQGSCQLLSVFTYSSSEGSFSLFSNFRAQACRMCPPALIEKYVL